jgi:hypothetical protein
MNETEQTANVGEEADHFLITLSAIADAKVLA